MRIVCPSCDKTFGVSDNTLAETVNCPRCGAAALTMPPVQIPDDFAAAAGDMPLGDDLAEFMPRPTRLAPLVIVSVFLIGITAIGAVLFVWSREAKKNPRPSSPVAEKRHEESPERRRDPDDPAILFGMGMATLQGIVCIVSIGWLIAWVFACIWVARDSRRRMGDSGGVWVIVIILTGLVSLWPIGLLVYVAARPNGPLVPCPNCGMERLAVAKICPHCAERTA